MEPDSDISHPAPISTLPVARSSGMAKVALGLSIFAFIVPLGIAAIVLGHMADKRIDSSAGSLNGKAMAQAALRIAYIQLALALLSGVILWGFFRQVGEGFQRDAMVQRVLRANDATRPLDPQSAQEAEGAAQLLMYQLIAIEEQTRRDRDDGAYDCNLNNLVENGGEGLTDAEKRAFAVRIVESPYIYQVSNCNPIVSGMPTAAFTLTAVPRFPRMPEQSRLFCADQTGVMRQVRDGTSLDCLENGQPVR